ncbi:hypothetical protein [Undibacterium sp. SXout20W]|uniref:hypothetical protein n=1 Tax=Undibacterium sp. SXout20W TaxID=3413051 RepID=UPI003BEFDC8E
MSIAKIVGRLGLLLALCMVMGAGAVFAQVTADRQFPPNTKQGVLDMSTYPTIKMNGYERRLSPSSRIYSVTNLIVTPATLLGSSFVVNYTENQFKDIDKVWILTQSEKAKGPPNSTSQVMPPLAN